LLGFNWGSNHLFHGANFGIFKLLSRQKIFVHEKIVGIFGARLNKATRDLISTIFSKVEAILRIEAAKLELGFNIFQILKIARLSVR